MKNNLNIILGVLVYFASLQKNIEVVSPVVTIEDPSIVGCYVAKLAKDVYVLNIQSDTNNNVSGMIAFNNYEKDSSSGSFVGTYKDGILLGDYVFSSEGMDSTMQVVFKKQGDAFVRGYGSVKTEGDKVIFENLAEIAYDNNVVFTRNVNCIEKFSEVNNKFTFNYNPFFKAYEPNQIDVLPSTDWKMNAKQKGMLLARVAIPKIYMSNTNFSSAYLTVGASTDPKEIKSCAVGMSGEVKQENKNINGFSFVKFVSSDAGAGNLYETTSYRGLVDGDCYAIEYTIHSTNIGNYSPDQGVKEFDKAQIQNEFVNMISSFKFLVNSN